FNGVNLIANGAANFDALSDAAGNTLTVTAQDLSLGGANVTVAAASDISTNVNATATLALVEASIDNVSNSLAQLGTSSKALEVHNNFVGKLSDALETGIGNLVDADLAKESARLQSLQVKQQLGTQALSIANQAPGTVLSLFR
ncbi:MAG: flagellin, partial [Caulobacterales bacterium]|nr:flagellin [Caulobacterales bacterium]